MTQNLITHSCIFKLQVIKVPKHSAGAFGQYCSFRKVGEKVVFFGSRSKTTGKFVNLKIV